MASCVKDLCRLCAKKDELLKDLLETDNKNIVQLIQQFTQIIVDINDKMPTKICLDCEEKIVNFQLFVIECHKAQEFIQNKLDKLCKTQLIVEVNDSVEQPVVPTITLKNEVKLECFADDEEICLEPPELTNKADIEDDDFHDMPCDDEELEDIAIASLKRILEKQEMKNGSSNIELEENISKKSHPIKTDFIKLECSQCNLSFNFWNAYKKHCHNEHKKEPVVTCTCGYNINTKRIFYRHLAQHNVPIKKANGGLKKNRLHSSKKVPRVNLQDYVKFTCRVCDRAFSSWTQLEGHCKRCHKITPVVTCSCGIEMKSKSVVYKHVQEHGNPEVLFCDVCPHVSKTAKEMEKHKMRHVPKSERKYVCTDCDKVFCSKDRLKSHQKSHIPIEERRVIDCGMCEMKFTTRSSATSHRRIVHDKIKGYICDLCGYSCGTGGELRQHRAIHSDDKPYNCQKCTKQFKTFANLKTHMDTHDDTSYPCMICNRVLNSRRTLRKHLLVHEDKCKHICTYCNKAFKRRQTLIVHQYSHTGHKPLSCKDCGERFAYASTLRNHRLRCHTGVHNESHTDAADRSLTLCQRSSLI